MTIAATYGAGGSVVAPAVARRLGLTLIDRAIAPELAAKMDMPLRAALESDEDRGRGVNRVLEWALTAGGLFVGVPPAPEALGAEDDIARTESMLHRLADAEGAVILGRAGVFVLQGRSDTLHVRLDGPVEARRRQAMTQRHLDYETVSREQEQADRARRAYVEHFHPRQRDWTDIRNYHLVIDSTVVSLETCVELIARAAGDAFRHAHPHVVQPE